MSSYSSSNTPRASYITPPRAAILEALADVDGPVTVEALRKHVDVPPRTLTHHLDVLESLDAIQVRVRGAPQGLNRQHNPDPAESDQTVEVTRQGAAILEEYTPTERLRDDHPAGDFSESSLSDEQRIGELESELAELQATVDDLQEELADARQRTSAPGPE